MHKLVFNRLVDFLLFARRNVRSRLAFRSAFYCRRGFIFRRYDYQHKLRFLYPLAEKKREQQALLSVPRNVPLYYERKLFRRIGRMARLCRFNVVVGGLFICVLDRMQFGAALRRDLQKIRRNLPRRSSPI